MPPSPPQTSLRLLRRPFAGRRRARRSRRLRLHPDRKRRSERETLLTKVAAAAVAQLHRASEAHERLVSENGEIKTLAARARADLENLRRRAAREKEDAAKFAIQEFVESLLPVLDSFDHALASTETGADPEALIGGIKAIRQQFDKALQTHGVDKVEARLRPFDPRLHEAMCVEKSEDHPGNTVIDVVQNGYLLNGRLLRAARVRISQKP